mmetsp:Transcript_57897/g.179929  ORF Transcript_57897/g.179929 Transcript_57897/m.179929 type:complete len:81 (+) Transcript_57897:806-1048(+)
MAQILFSGSLGFFGSCAAPDVQMGKCRLGPSKTAFRIHPHECTCTSVHSTLNGWREHHPLGNEAAQLSFSASSKTGLCKE